MNPILRARNLNAIYSELDRWDALISSSAAFVNTAYLTEEPSTYKEALQSSNSANWQQAMAEEYLSLIQNETWSLEYLPPGRKTVKNKWVFKVKPKADGSIERFKARLVAKGYSQSYGVDYDETYAPVT